MGDKVTLNLDSTQSDELQAMVEEGAADSMSEAGRQALNAGLVELGRLNGTPEEDVAWVAREIGKLFAYFGIAYLAFTFLFPVTLRIWTVFFFISALGAYGIAAVVERGIIPVTEGEPA